MATQRENVQINLKIQGIEDFKRYKDLVTEVNAQKKAVIGMDKQDPGYAQAAEKLQKLIALQKEWRKQIYGTNQDVDEVKSAWDKIAEIAGGVSLGNLVSDGIQAAIDKVMDFVSGAQEAYAEAEQGQAQLNSVLASTGSVVGRTADQLNDMSGALMNLTGVDDDVITKSESLLLTFTNIRGEIFDKTLPAIVDMTAALNKGNVSMETIQATTLQVGKALNDPVKGMTALRKVGVSFTEDQIKLVKTLVQANDAAGAQTVILNELGREFGGMAQSMASTDTGQLNKMQTRLGNIQESLGKLITEGKSSFSLVFAPLVTWLERATATRLSDTLDRDRAALAANVLQLQASNTSHETRVSIIKSLKEQYPAYLAQIDAEKSSNSKLLPILNEINKALVLKIAFQKRNEGLNDAMEDEADLFLKQDKAATQLSQTMAVIMDRARDKGLNIVIPKNLSDIEQAEFLVNRLKASVGDGSGVNVKMGVHDLEVAQENLLQLRYAYAEATREREKLLNDQTGFAKKYGLDQGGNTKTMAQNNTAPPVVAPNVRSSAGDDAKRKKDIEDAKQMDKELTEAAKALGVERMNNLLSEHLKEEALVSQKYQKLIDKEKEFLLMKGATAEQRAKHEREIADLEAAKSGAVGELRTRTEAKVNNEIATLRASLVKDLSTELDKEKDTINRFYDQQEKLYAGNAQRIAELKKQRAADLTDAEIREAERLEEEKKRITQSGETFLDDTKANRLLKINNQYDLEIEALKKKFSTEAQLTQEYQVTLDAINANRTEAIRAEERKGTQEKMDIGIQAAETLNNTITTISANNRRRETDIAMQNLERQRDQELSNKNLTEEQKKAINDKFDEKIRAEKLRAWRADQSAAAKQALISGLLGAAKAMPNFLLAALAMGTGLANAAAIRAEKPPIYRKGAMIPNGPSHENGGIALIDNSTGGQIGEMEGGEPIMILSKETARNNMRLVNELLYNSQFRNGARVQVDADLASKAIRPFNTGGVIQPAGSEFAVPAPAVPVQTSFDTASLELKFEQKLDELLDAWREGLPINYRYQTEYHDKIAKLKSSVNAKSS